MATQPELRHFSIFCTQILHRRSLGKSGHGQSSDSVGRRRGEGEDGEICKCDAVMGEWEKGKYALPLSLGNESNNEIRVNPKGLSSYDGRNLLLIFLSPPI